MPRSIRTLALAGAVSALIAVVPAGAGAATTADPTNLDFGSLPVGTQSPSLPVTLSETCTADILTCITIPSVFDPVISATTGFTQTNACPTSLIASLSLVPVPCTIEVSMVPNVIGQITGLLNTGAGGPAVTLSGVGTAPPSSSGNSTKRKKCKKRHKAAATNTAAGSTAQSAKKKCKRRK